VDLAPVEDGLPGVDHQVQAELLELLAVAADPAAALGT
jgi:hypothetical protein